MSCRFGAEAMASHPGNAPSALPAAAHVVCHVIPELHSIVLRWLEASNFERALCCSLWMYPPFLHIVLTR